MKCFAFDLGKVLFNFDYGIALKKIESKIGVPQEEIIHHLFYKNFADDFEKGLINAPQFYGKFKNTFKCSASFNEFADIWCNIFSPNHNVIGLAERLSYIYPVYLISNINELHFEHLHKNHPDVFSFFNGLVLSYKEKTIKPEKEIYQLLKNASGYRYEDIIYIDDRIDLIHKAKDLNLKCINFTGFNELLDELKLHDVVIPTEGEKTILESLRSKILKSKNPLIVGVGNTDKSDDGAGIYLTEEIKNKTRLKTVSAGAAVENYLGTITKHNPDLVIFIDCASTPEPQTFGCFAPEAVADLPLRLTHDGSLRMIAEYLQNVSRSDILFLAISGFNYSLGQDLSNPVRKQLKILGNFFQKHFS